MCSGDPLFRNVAKGSALGGVWHFYLIFKNLPEFFKTYSARIFIIFHSPAWGNVENLAFIYYRKTHS